jgi:hypothetical protein
MYPHPPLSFGIHDIRSSQMLQIGFKWPHSASAVLRFVLRSARWARSYPDELPHTSRWPRRSRVALELPVLLHPARTPIGVRQGHVVGNLGVGSFRHLPVEIVLESAVNNLPFIEIDISSARPLLRPEKRPRPRRLPWSSSSSSSTSGQIPF